MTSTVAVILCSSMPPSFAFARYYDISSAILSAAIPPHKADVVPPPGDVLGRFVAREFCPTLSTAKHGTQRLRTIVTTLSLLMTSYIIYDRTYERCAVHLGFKTDERVARCLTPNPNF